MDTQGDRGNLEQGEGMIIQLVTSDTLRDTERVNN